jgi:hypothetical protein
MQGFVSKNMQGKKSYGAPRRRWLAYIQKGLRSALCVISGFRREADDNCTLLRYYSGLTETLATVYLAHGRLQGWALVSAAMNLDVP